jgi:DeoR/GlpR family transcriptional regulator of sugar metabolism
MSLRRVLALLRHVETMRYAPSLVDLAREFNVTDRTIRRDLELLEEVGFRVPRWRDEQRKSWEAGS